MLFEKDKLQVATDGFINSKRGSVELNEFCREIIQLALQIIAIKTKSRNRKVLSSLQWVPVFLAQYGNIKSNNFYCLPIDTNISSGMKPWCNMQDIYSLYGCRMRQDTLECLGYAHIMT